MNNTFQVESGSLYVTDPCYDKGTWCQALLDNVRNGTWRMHMEHTNEGDWGRRVSELICAHEKAGILRWEKHPADIGVDSGQAGVFDAAHYKNDADYEGFKFEWPESPLTGEGAFYDACCDVTLCETKDGGGVVPFGAVSRSGFGDGGYDLYIAKDEDGQIVATKIVFIDLDAQDDDDDFWADEDDEKTRKIAMKYFSLIENDGGTPDLPRGLIVVFGYKKDAVACTDYDGLADRPVPETVDGEWFPLSTDFDSIMAWHGERKNNGHQTLVRIHWKKRGQR